MIKRLFAFLFFILCIYINNKNINAQQTNVIYIENVQQLKDIKNNISGNYALKNDIDLNNELWTPIPKFYGTLDGKGFKIKNLNISTSTYSGLFGDIISSEIKNLIIENVKINSPSQSGGIAGSASSSKIINCAVIGKGEIICTRSGYNVGGLFGSSYSTTIENSFANINVTSSVNDVAGGLVGISSKDLIKNCFYTGKLKGGANSGGLIGKSTNSKIENSYFAGYLFLNTLHDQCLVGLASTATTIINSYFDSNLSVHEKFIQNENSKTTYELMKKETYTNWSFTDVWEFKKGYLYPTLSSFNIIPEGMAFEATGTKTNPFIISTKAELLEINNNVEGYFELANDIDLAGVEWIPIKNFSGFLDGKNFKVKNLKIVNQQDAGFFGTANYSQIKNFTIENVNISDSNGYYGGLVGKDVGSEITNCAVSGTGKLDKSYGNKNDMGGLIGIASYSKIEQCYTTIDVINCYSGDTAGLVGEMYNSSLKNCYATGSISSTGTTDASCIVGTAYNSTIANCLFLGKSYRIIKPRQVMISGSYNSTITNCYFDLSKAPEGSYEDGVYAKTSEELKQKSLYLGWDFENIWEFNETTGLPKLREIAGITNPNLTPNIIGKEVYKYDKINRLTEVIYADGSKVIYTYDAAGNIKTVKKVKK